MIQSRSRAASLKYPDQLLLITSLSILSLEFRPPPQARKQAQRHSTSQHHSTSIRISNALRNPSFQAAPACKSSASLCPRNGHVFCVALAGEGVALLLSVMPRGVLGCCGQISAPMAFLCCARPASEPGIIRALLRPTGNGDLHLE